MRTCIYLVGHAHRIKTPTVQINKAQCSNKEIQMRAGFSL